MNNFRKICVLLVVSNAVSAMATSARKASLRNRSALSTQTELPGFQDLQDLDFQDLDLREEAFLLKSEGEQFPLMHHFFRTLPQHIIQSAKRFLSPKMSLRAEPVTHLIAHRSASQDPQDPKNLEFGVELDKLQAEAEKLPVTQHVFRSLPQEIMTDAKWSNYVAPHMRGRGWWFWKAAIPNLLMKQGSIRDGDLIMYADGDHAESLSKFYNMAYPALTTTDTDVYMWVHGWCENQWTKGDIFQKFDRESDDSRYGWSKQPWAAFYAVRVNARSRKFLELFENLVADLHLVSDEPNTAGTNLPDFMGNRHDQSLLSMLVKANLLAPPEKFYNCVRLAGDSFAYHERVISEELTRHPTFGIDGLNIKLEAGA